MPWLRFTGKVRPKAYVMDDERIKSGDSILTKQYFKEQLERIRTTCLNERKINKAITDIHSTSINYVVTVWTIKWFFAMVQNKPH